MTADEGATSGETTYYYNASKGEVTTAKPTAGYGHEYKATQADPVGTGLAKDATAKHTDQVVMIKITAKTDGTATTEVSWVDKA